MVKNFDIKTEGDIEYFHSLTKGISNYSLFHNNIINHDLKRLNDKLKKVSKRKNDGWLKANIKMLRSKPLNNIKLQENSLLYKCNGINIDISDGGNVNEVMDLGSNLYKHEELTSYFNLSKLNNFNLMKLIWNWMDQVLKTAKLS